MKNPSNLMNLPEKVFFKASLISKQQRMEIFTYCYQKYNNFNTAQSYGGGLN